MTHIGKIGRLPKHLRHELGRRLDDGQTGATIVQWLNDQQEVQAVLGIYFEGRPITEQNLSDWRQTGHLEWLRREEIRASALQLNELSEDLEQATDGSLASDQFARVVAVEMTRMARNLLDGESDPEKRWHRLCGIHRELSLLRRDDHRAVRTAIKKSRWDRQTEREDIAAEREEEAAQNKRSRTTALAPRQNKLTAKVFDGSDYAQRMAELLGHLDRSRPVMDQSTTTGTNPNKNEKIQPNKA